MADHKPWGFVYYAAAGVTPAAVYLARRSMNWDNEGRATWIAAAVVCLVVARQQVDSIVSPALRLLRNVRCRVARDRTAAPRAAEAKAPG